MPVCKSRQAEYFSRINQSMTDERGGGIGLCFPTHQKRREHVEAVSQHELENEADALLNGGAGLDGRVLGHAQISAQQNDPPQPGINLHAK